jgi:hypothetical protein
MASEKHFAGWENQVHMVESFISHPHYRVRSHLQYIRTSSATKPNTGKHLKSPGSVLVHRVGCSGTLVLIQQRISKPSTLRTLIAKCLFGAPRETLWGTQSAPNSPLSHLTAPSFHLQNMLTILSEQMALDDCKGTPLSMSA